MLVSMPSTVGPSVPTRASSNTMANATGAESMAQRDRETNPASSPTVRPITIDHSTCDVVRGPRGVHHPANSLQPAATAVAATTPRRRSAHNGPKTVRVPSAHRCRVVETVESVVDAVRLSSSIAS